MSLLLSPILLPVNTLLRLTDQPGKCGKPVINRIVAATLLGPRRAVGIRARLDQTKMDRNIARMKARVSALDVSFRPHLKTAKSVEVARRMMPAPAGPATVSTLAEAERFFAAIKTTTNPYTLQALGEGLGALPTSSATSRAT